MKKAVITLIIIAGIAGTGYYSWQKGYLGRLVPALSVPGETESELQGRVSSTDENAVYVDSVSVLANLGSGDGLTERFAGVVEAQDTKDYKADSDRTIDETYVKEGDEVKAGDRLFSYDVSSEQDKLEQAQIDLERAQNSMDISEQKKAQLEQELAKANTASKRLQILEEQNSIKQQELDIKSKQKKIETIQEQIDNSVVTCDIDGIVKTINASAAGGSSSSYSSDPSSGSGAYITILKTGTYRIKGQANEQNIASVFQGEQMLVHSRVNEDQTWTGVVSQIKMDQGSEQQNSDSMYGYSGGDSSGSTNYPFYVELDSSDGLMLGQHVYLEQDLGQGSHKDGLWIDDYYVVTDDDGSSYVWAASPDNTLEKRKVTLGETDEDSFKVEIKDGLSEEDYIAMPYDGLTEGLPVAYNDSTMSSQELQDSMYTYDEGAALPDGYEYGTYETEDGTVYSLDADGNLVPETGVDFSADALAGGSAGMEGYPGDMSAEWAGDYPADASAEGGAEYQADGSAEGGAEYPADAGADDLAGGAVG